MMQLIQNKPEKNSVNKVTTLSTIKFSASNFFIAIVQCACNVKTKYQGNPLKAVVGVDQPMYTLM